MLAHDTRPSAEALTKAAAAGVAAMGGLPIACGLLTTPQLHWMVRQCNAGLKHKEKAYYEALATGFARLASGATTLAELCPEPTAGTHTVIPFNHHIRMVHHK